jgi:hypothetical protein
VLQHMLCASTNLPSIPQKHSTLFLSPNNTTLPSPKPNATDFHEIALRGKILMFGIPYLI